MSPVQRKPMHDAVVEILESHRNELEKQFFKGGAALDMVLQHSDEWALSTDNEHVLKNRLVVFAKFVTQFGQPFWVPDVTSNNRGWRSSFPDMKYALREACSIRHPPPVYWPVHLISFDLAE